MFDQPWRSLVSALFAAAVAVVWLKTRPFGYLSRTIALALAIWSHGPKEGAPADRCFPARAEHFRCYLRTGLNPKPVEPARLDVIE